MEPVHVVALITAKPGMREALLEAFRAFQTKVGDDTFVVVEKWASLDALKAHAAAPHMAAYAAQAKDMIADRVIHVLSPT
jgi:quinol monooxygenase YgiN